MLTQLKASAAITGIKVAFANHRNLSPRFESKDAAFVNRNPEKIKSRPARAMPLDSTARIVSRSGKVDVLYHRV